MKTDHDLVPPPIVPRFITVPSRGTLLLFHSISILYFTVTVSNILDSSLPAPPHLLSPPPPPRTSICFWSPDKRESYLLHYVSRLVHPLFFGATSEISKPW